MYQKINKIFQEIEITQENVIQAKIALHLENIESILRNFNQAGIEVFGEVLPKRVDTIPITLELRKNKAEDKEYEI